MHLSTKMKLYAAALGSAILVSSSYAKDVTIKVESSSYTDATLVFSIDGNKINSLSKTFSTQGPQFNKACSLYGAIDAEGRINTQVKLNLTGFNLEDGRTLLVASVNASKAGPTNRQSVLGQDGKLTKTADCPSTNPPIFHHTRYHQAGRNARTVQQLGCQRQRAAQADRYFSVGMITEHEPGTMSQYE